jgi:hypothetical protein
MLCGRAIKLKRLTVLLLSVAAGLADGPVYGGTCSNPTRNEGDQFYNGDFHTWEFCNGTSWMAFGGGNSCSGGSGYSPTAPSNSGYFVMSGTQWNGNLGDVTGADALCYTELTSTNTSWKGYSTANSNGQLVASKIHAFICDTTTCNNLMPLTTYYFAVANSSSAGGASFTTDSNGLGPNDSANWSAANYFSGTYNYWASRLNTSSTAFSNASSGGAPGYCGYYWNTGTSGGSAYIGNSAQTNANRWNDTSFACNNTFNLICFVNP